MRGLINLDLHDRLRGRDHKPLFRLGKLLPDRVVELINAAQHLLISARRIVASTDSL